MRNMSQMVEVGDLSRTRGKAWQIAAKALSGIMVWIAAGSVAWSAGYDVVFEHAFRSRDATYARVNSLIKTHDGGYAFAGLGYASRSWVVKTDSNGSKQWETLLPATRGSEQQVYVLLEATDGGLFAFGTTNSHDLVVGNWGNDGKPPLYKYYNTPTKEFVARIEHDGKESWRKLLGSKDEGDGGSVHCGATSDGSLILVGGRLVTWHGQPTPTGLGYQSVVWIARMDASGDVAWHSSVGEDRGELLSAHVIDPQACSPPLVAEDGSFVVAVAVEKRDSLMRDGKRIVAGPEIKARAVRPFVLVLRFDRDGRELVRARVEGALHPRLVALPDGYALLDNPVPLQDHGIRLIRFDRRLGVIGPKESKRAGFTFLLRGVQPDGDGGYLVAGYEVDRSGSRGKPAIAHLRKDRTLTALKTFGVLLSDWGQLAAIAPGANPREFVILRQGGRSESVGLVKVRLKD